MSSATPTPPGGYDPPPGGSVPGGSPSGGSDAGQSASGGSDAGQSASVGSDAAQSASGGSDAGGRPGAGPDRLFAWLRDLGLRRDTSNKWVAGVCSGIAERVGVDPIVIRAVAVALFLFGGTGFILYAVAWAFLPSRDGMIRAEAALRGDAGGIVLLVVISLALLGEITDRQHWSWLFVPVGVAVWYVVRGARRGQTMPQIGADAKAQAQGVARTVQGWGASPGGQPGAADAGAPSPASVSPMSASPGMPSDPPHGMGPGRTRSPSTPPVPPVVVVRTRRAGIGFPGVIAVLGLALLAFGIATASGATARPVAFGLACAVGVLGLSLLVVALFGRRAGGLATLGIAAALATALAVSVPASLTMSGLGAGAGERTWKPAEGAGDPAYQLGAGQARLDLSGLSTDGPDNQPVSASVSLGELIVTVPQGLTVRVDAKVGAGEIVRKSGSEHAPDGEHREGTDLHESVLVGSGPPDAVVTADIGLGSLTIVNP
ncbi:MAG: PspC domain-containing protein [Dermatophilaceae bacterium]